MGLCTLHVTPEKYFNGISLGHAYSIHTCLCLQKWIGSEDCSNARRKMFAPFIFPVFRAAEIYATGTSKAKDYQKYSLQPPYLQWFSFVYNEGYLCDRNCGSVSEDSWLSIFPISEITAKKYTKKSYICNLLSKVLKLYNSELMFHNTLSYAKNFKCFSTEKDVTYYTLPIHDIMDGHSEVFS
uniref:Uncharacterized protein n=1 Tax=Megaselia scalaris TaxID=36166 RepID=T1GI95_MEGSC